MARYKGLPGFSLAQREACSVCERKRNKTEQSLAICNPMNPTATSPAKQPRHVQLRLYLPADTVKRLKALSPPLRNAIVASRLRAMAWEADLDPIRLQGALEALKEACVLARQILRKDKGKMIVVNPGEQILDIMEQLLRP
jgi:hypothetical protein